MARSRRAEMQLGHRGRSQGRARSHVRRERGAWGSWPEHLVRWLDDGFRVPGTRFRFGLDGVLGLLLPSVGDAVTGVGSISLLLLAVREGVPRAVLVRMVWNVVVDLVVGSIPFVGDAFDFVWKSNRRNLQLLERSRRSRTQGASAGDYAVAGVGIAVAIAAIVVPFLVLFWLGGTLWGWAAGG